MISELTVKYAEANGNGVGQPLNLRGPEENHERPQPRQAVTRLIFEPGSSRIRRRGANNTRAILGDHATWIKLNIS
jgi:hypothetical protein